MEYAGQLLIPIMLGLFLGQWLQNTFNMSPLITVLLAVLGMAAGMGLMYKRLMYPQLYQANNTDDSRAPDKSIHQQSAPQKTTVPLNEKHSPEKFRPAPLPIDGKPTDADKLNAQLNQLLMQDDETDEFSEQLDDDLV